MHLVEPVQHLGGPIAHGCLGDGFEAGVSCGRGKLDGLIVGELADHVEEDCKDDEGPGACEEQPVLAQLGWSEQRKYPLPCVHDTMSALHSLQSAAFPW